MLAAMAPLLAGCNEPVSATAAAKLPEPEVGTFTVRSQARAITRELPGRIAPTRVSEVRARVSGIVVERLFQQGTEVKAGDPLYRIDPKPFEVELQASEAALDKAEAALDLATQHARRIATLTSQRAAPEAQNEKAIAAQREAEAEVGSRQAEVARAKLNLDYATIRAPISGVVGAALVSEGALVVQNDTTSLATIQQLDPIYADFTQSVSEMNKLRRAFDSGDLDRIAPDAAKVRLVLDDGTVYPVPGKLLFSEAKVDAFTGQVTLRVDTAGWRQVVSGPPDLARAAIENLRHWQFAGNPSAPFEVFYDYSLVEGDCGPQQNPTVRMELPFRVSIVAKRPATCGR